MSNPTRAGVAIALLALSGCAMVPTQPTARTTEITQVQATKFDSGGAYKAPELVWRKDWGIASTDFMRAQLITIDGQHPNVGFYFQIDYRSSKWRFYRSASLDNATRLPATKAGSSDVSMCRGGLCNFTERVAVMLPRGYFAGKHRTGFEIRMNAESGPEVIVAFPADHVEKMLAAVPGLRPASASIDQPAPASTVSTPTPAPTVQGSLGAESHQIERLPAVKACHAAPRAMLTSKGPGFELYTVACSNGDALTVRCELGACRVLR